MRLFIALMSVLFGWTLVAFVMILWKMLDP